MMVRKNTLSHYAAEKPRMKRRETGFTLLETMAALGIVAILVALAYPNYTGYVVKTRRADAQGSLMALANAMEREYSKESTYANATLGSGAGDIFPDQAPLDGGTKYYTLSIQSADATSFTLRATPISPGPQSADGYLELLSTGLRRWDRNNDADTDDVVDGKSEKSWD